MARIQYRKCPVCGNENVKPLEKITLCIPAECKLPESYQVCSCESCGFCYADTSASQEDYDDYYAAFNSYSGTPVADSTWNGLHNSAIGLLDQAIGKEKKILDMGFGKGTFLKRLYQEGRTSMVGIDPSVDSVKAMEKLNIDIRLGSVMDPVPGGLRGTFSCVCLFDVLEHLLFPGEAVLRLTQYLEKDGYLLLSVPNCGCLRTHAYPIVNVFNQEHINYFSQTSLDNLLGECGFRRVSAPVAEQEEIVALYRFAGQNQKRLQKDVQSLAEIEAYIESFEEKKHLLNHQLKKLIKKGNKEIYVWGTGAYTMWLLGNTVMSEFTIEFIDNNVTKIGKRFWNGEIISPDDIQGDKTIVICSMLYAKDIENQIRNMGLLNPIISM